MNAPNRTTLAQWFSAISRREHTCPWAGPRPVEVGDPDYFLVGRADDAAKFGSAVDGNQLVVLDGESGVGKTSLLQRALVPRLEELGFLVAVCRDWKDDPDVPFDDDGTLFLAKKVHAAFHSSHDPRVLELAERHAPDATLFVTAEAECDDRLVLILDQFEELMRVSELRASQLIERVLDLNHGFHTKVVISLRSEYVHRLRQLEQEARPYSYTAYHLSEVETEKAIAAIRPPELAEQITEEAGDFIADRWRDAHDAHRGGRGVDDGAVGLLHLGSLMYALHFRAWEPSTDTFVTITAEMVESIIDVDAPRRGFFAAMRHVVDIKLDIGLEQAAGIGLADPFLLEGIQSGVRRCAPMLSSGGFKVHRDSGDLAFDVLRPELDSLARGLGPLGIDVDEGFVGEVLQRFLSAGESTSTTAVDLLGGPWHSLSAALVGSSLEEVLIPHLAITEEAILRCAADPREVTCGPMMGLSPVAVLVEEVRRFAVALLWMRQSLLVRFSSPTASQTVVSLIHDRFGDGLEAWALNRKDDPHAALHAVTAPQGASFYWKKDDGTFHSLLDGGDGGWVIANLRWKGGWVCADFRKVIFANCDLRGAMFSQCTFEGVDFVNCLLDGVMYDKCVFKGVVSPARETSWKNEPSRFVIATAGDTDPYTTESIIRYRGFGSGTDSYSASAGLPLLPMQARERLGDTVTATEWTPSVGGVCIYGGRISSVTLRSCDCALAHDDRGPGLALRHVGGTGLSFVEQVAPMVVEVHASALRHTSFSTIDRPNAPVQLHFHVSATVLLQTWVSPGFTGTATIRNSRIAQYWNGAGLVTTTFDGSSNVFGAVGGSIDDSSTDLALAVHGSTSVYPDCEAVEHVVQIAPTMDEVDYRNSPERRFFADIAGSGPSQVKDVR